MKNIGNEGKPATDRGKPPHKGGACSGKNKGSGKRKTYFSVSVRTDKGRIEQKAASPWKPGK